MIEHRSDTAENVTVEQDKGEAIVTLRSLLKTEQTEDGTQYVYKMHQFKRPYSEDLKARYEQNYADEFAMHEQEEAQQKANAVRAIRDRLLTACDYRVAIDYPATDEERDAWIVYRQALRDVPEQNGFPDSVDWPVPPGRDKAEDTIIKVIDIMLGEEV